MGMVDVQLGNSHGPDAEIPEGEVIQRVMAGETDLYGVLVDRYSRRLHQFVRRIVRNDMDAEDIVQGAHVRALAYLHQFGGRCKFVTWLSHVAANEAFRQLRQQRRLDELFHSLAAESGAAGLFVSAARDPESCIRDSETREILRRALAKLPPQYRVVFLLREVGNVTTPEVARRLQIRCDNVRLKLYRARRLLRKAISRYWQ